MSTSIQAEWLFPLGGGANVSVTGAEMLGWVALRIWATDRDYWEADDNSHALPTRRRMGYEYEPLTYVFTCSTGTLEGYGQFARTVSVTWPPEGGRYDDAAAAPIGPVEVKWHSRTPEGIPLMPGATDFVAVTINDGNLANRDDSQVGLGVSILVMGAWTIRDIVLQGYPSEAGAMGPGTSGHGWPPDEFWRAWLSVTAAGPAVQEMSASTAFGNASGNSNTVYITIPKEQEHGMYGVGVWARRTQWGPPGGPAGEDSKSANFAVLFHHCWYRFDEVAGGWNLDPNWFQGFQGGVPSNRHWNDYIGADGQGVRYHWNLENGTAIGVLDIWGTYGPAGTCYIGEIHDQQVPANSHHFWRSERFSSHLGWYDTSDPPDGSGDEADVIYYRGLDNAGQVVKHELEHKRFWELEGNWEGYTPDKIGTPQNPWPYNPNSGYDNDADGVKDEYEDYLRENYGLPYRWRPSNGEPWWKWMFSLYMGHNGVSEPPASTEEEALELRGWWGDIEFETRWWGERVWEKQEWVLDDWSDHGEQMERY